MLAGLASLGGLIGCGSSSSSESSEPNGSSIENESGEGRGGEAAASQGVHPEAAASLQMQQDLLSIAHLADVEHRGLFIDFGTPGRMKYTIGHWRTGWGSDGADGDDTYTYGSETNRVYFPLAEAAPITLRLRMKQIGSRRLQIFINDRSLAEGIVLAEDSDFHDYDVPVPGELTRAGENYMLLRFGGSTPVEGENVAVAMASIRVIAGPLSEGERFVPPTDLVASMDVGGTTRQAIAVHPPTTLSFHLQIPPGGRLVFGAGAEGDAADVRARVVVQAEGGEASVRFDETIPPGRWSDQSIDLSDLAGQIAKIDLVAEGEGEGRLGWSDPALMIPPPQTRELAEVRNVVVLLIDTMRASKLRPYRPESRVRTPTFDRIASEGTLFEAAQSQENWTKPSVASVLTGMTPASHGAKTSEARLPESVQMVSEVFDEAGFATGSFIANGYVSDRFGFDQGWDHYTNFIRETKRTTADNVFREAGDWIEAHKDERFFAYVHTIDPHVPYDPPEEYLRMYDSRTDYEGQVRPRMTGELLEQAKRNPPAVTFSASDVRRLEALHDGAISFHDHEFGEFITRLENLGVLDQTLVVVTSDHGEEFQDHGSWGHGHSVYQELLNVPLVFWRPGVVPVQRVPHTVSTASVSPTVLELAGLPALRAAELPSLATELRGNMPVGPRVAFSDFLDDRRVIRAGRWKLILRGHNPTMFDLESDPSEQHELDRNRHPIAARFLRVMLGQYLGARDRGQWLQSEQQDGTRFQTENAEMDQTIRDQLRALGYLQD